MSLSAPYTTFQNGSDKNNWLDQATKEGQRNLGVQVAISVVFGLSAFLTFCVGILSRYRLYG